MSDRVRLPSPLFPLQFVLKNYGENPENYNEELRKLELLRQVSWAPAWLTPSLTKTSQNLTGAGSSPTPCLRTCLLAHTTSLHQELCWTTAVAAPLPHQWPMGEAFSSPGLPRCV